MAPVRPVYSNFLGALIDMVSMICENGPESTNDGFETSYIESDIFNAIFKVEGPSWRFYMAQDKEDLGWTIHDENPDSSSTK